MVDFLSNHFVFRPPNKPTFKFKRDSRNTIIRTVNGNDIHVLLVCPFNADTSITDYKCITEPKPLLVYFHGNAEDLHTGGKSYCQWLADFTDNNVLTCDYPGYGFSHGEATESGLHDAAIALLYFAVSELKLTMDNIVIIGKSLGSVPAVYAASQAQCVDLAGLVLISPIASGFRCMNISSHMPNFLLRRLDELLLPNITRINCVCCPIQFIHGLQDTVVSCSNTRDLIAALYSPCLTKPMFVEANHNDIESKFKTDFINTIQIFLQKCKERSTSRCDYKHDNATSLY
jgi:fermentation-respiration switch protein FrsA (DUF1100 family)